MSEPQSSVEIPTAPAWLSKLESRREKLSKAKIGHESGAGAACIVCGADCPGLDLHFWRKVCRNCKCRKDQHDIQDDEFSRWAQFEILGAIRSKPAFISVSALANKQVQLDWIPPNVTPDLANDYLSQLRADQIPISGSAAASYRKQQLEYQVPPHDLDPNLCDNLSSNEQEQLKEHVTKIKTSCVGQGFVTRVGLHRGSIANIDTASNEIVRGQRYTPIKHGSPANKGYINAPGTVNTNQISEIFDPVGKPVLPSIEKDKILSMILNSDTVKGVRFNPTQIRSYETIQIYDSLGNRIPTMKADFVDTPYLSQVVKDKLIPMKINSEVIQSSVVHGWAYDKIFNDLDNKKLNYAHDSTLGPIKQFRTEYLKDKDFKNETDYYAVVLGGDIFSPYANKIAKVMQSDISPNHNSLVEHSLIKDKYHNTIIDSDNAHHSIPMYSKPFSNALNEPPPINFSTFPGANPQSRQDAKDTLRHSNSPLDNCVDRNSLSVKYFVNPMQESSVPSTVRESSSSKSAFSDNRSKDYTNNLPKPNSLNATNNHYANEQSTDIRNNPNDVLEALSEHLQNPLGYQLNVSKNPEFYLSSVLDCFKNPHSTAILSKPTNSRPADNIIHANPGKFFVNPDLTNETMAPKIQSGIIQNTFTPEHLSQDVGNMHITPSEELGNIPKVMCEECNKEIKSGGVAVQAERAGKNVAWHPQCFVCHTCHELLADLVYFYHKKHVYCARDLADILKIPRCKACDELIFTREYTAAEGSTFHIKHFCCFECDAPLADQSYTYDANASQPLCLQCYENFHAEKCKNCNKSIGASEQGVSLGSLHWHKSCFICFGEQCGKVLLGEKFSLKKEMLFCSAKCIQSRNANQ